MPASRPSNEDIEAVAQAILETDALGHADQADFVRSAAPTVGAIPDDVVERVAEEIFNDAGRNLPGEREMAHYILCRVRGHNARTAMLQAAAWSIIES